MKRNVLIGSVSALVLSTTAAFAGSGCGDKADLMQQAAMSVGSGEYQLAGAESDKTQVKPGEGQGPTEAVGEQVEGADKDKKAGEASEKAGHESPTEAVGEATPEMKPDGEAPAAGGAEAPGAGGAAAPAGDAAQQQGDKTVVKPGEGQGPTEAVGDAAKQSEDQPKDQSEVKQEGDKTKVKPAESPTPAP